MTTSHCLPHCLTAPLHQRQSKRLPDAPAEHLVISQALSAKLPERLDFFDFMQAALYDPEYGYYTQGQVNFGTGGDFITAPEISPLFGGNLAQQIVRMMPEDQAFGILELGPGKGTLAKDILTSLQAAKRLPLFYELLEVSAQLQAVQQQTLADFSHLTTWCQTLPEHDLPLIILANEVVDAMPVYSLIYWQGQWHHRQVGKMTQNPKQDHQAWCFLSPQQAPKPAAEAIQNYLHSTQSQPLDQQITEYNPQLAPWLASLYQTSMQVFMLIIDYGYPGSEIHHHERNLGTLRAHYQHHAHDDVLRLPGLQDITAHVDFSALAQAAVDSQWDVEGYTTQAWLLMGGGLMEQLHHTEDTLVLAQQSRQVQLLTSPEHLGENFKAIGLSKDWPWQLPGLVVRDLSHQL